MRKEWKWEELEPQSSFVFNAGIDLGRLAITLDLEPLLLFTEHFPDVSNQEPPEDSFSNFEAFEAMKAKFLPQYDAHELDAIQLDTEATNPTSESLSFNASTLLLQKEQVAQLIPGIEDPDWTPYEGDAIADAEDDRIIQEMGWGDDKQDGENQHEGKHDCEWDEDNDPQEDDSAWHPYSVNDSTQGEEGTWHEDGAGEYLEDAEGDQNGWYHQQ